MPAKLNKHPLNGTGFIAYPLEGHAFTVNPKDDYRCLICNRPRALHATEDDLIPQPPPEPEKCRARLKY